MYVKLQDTGSGGCLVRQTFFSKRVMVIDVLQALVPF